MTALAALVAGNHQPVPPRCAVRFTARSLGLPVRGGFDVRTVDVAIEADGTAVVTAVLAAASFRTRSDRRDRDVRSARFLDADRHPDIVFTGRWSVPGTAITGHLTVKDTPAPLVLELDDEPTREGGEIVARDRCRVDRRQFPVGPRFGPIGRWLDVEVEAVLRAT